MHAIKLLLHLFQRLFYWFGLLCCEIAQRSQNGQIHCPCIIKKATNNLPDTNVVFFTNWGTLFLIDNFVGFLTVVDRSGLKRVELLAMEFKLPVLYELVYVITRR